MRRIQNTRRANPGCAPVLKLQPGKNLFNPAMFGRLFYLFVFPDTILPWRQPVDMTTAATPLEVLRETGGTSAVAVMDRFLGRIPGTIGEISALMLLIGAA